MILGSGEAVSIGQTLLLASCIVIGLAEIKALLHLARLIVVATKILILCCAVVVCRAHLPRYDGSMYLDLVNTEFQVVRIENPDIGDVMRWIIGCLGRRGNVDRCIGTLTSRDRLSFMEIRSWVLGSKFGLNRRLALCDQKGRTTLVTNSEAASDRSPSPNSSKVHSS